MLLSDITTYPVLLPARAVEVSDIELGRITAENPRADLEQLLRVKRAPAVYYQLQGIIAQIGEQLAALDASDPTLEHHLIHKRSRQRWANLETMAKSQARWLLARVAVEADEVNDLVTRWLLLLFGAAQSTEHELAGRQVKNGIITPTPGGRHGESNPIR